MARMSPIFEIMGTAAKTEPDIADLLRHLLDERLQNMIRFVEWVAANGPLRGDLAIEAAGETVWMLTSAEVYHLLTVHRGWSSDRYEGWLTDLAHYAAAASTRGVSGDQPPLGDCAAGAHPGRAARAGL